MSKNPYAFEHYILSPDILEKIKMPQNSEERIHIPENIPKLILMLQHFGFHAPYSRLTDSLEAKPSQYTNGDNDSQHGQMDTLQNTQNSTLGADQPQHIDGDNDTQRGQRDTLLDAQDSQTISTSGHPPLSETSSVVTSSSSPNELDQQMNMDSIQSQNPEHSNDSTKQEISPRDEEESLVGVTKTSDDTANPKNSD